MLEKISKMNNVSFHLRSLDKGEEIKAKAEGNKEIINTGAETNKIDNRKTRMKINKTKS